MWSELTTKINTTLQKVSELQVIYDRPIEKGEAFSGYPAAVFYASGLENTFETNQENLKIYNFTIVLVTETNVAGINRYRRIAFYWSSTIFYR